MAPQYETFENLKQVLEARPLHLWVGTYTITHRVMELAFFHGEFLTYSTLVCRGAVDFRGRFEGGPYELSLERTSDGGFRLFDRGGQLSVSFEVALIRPGPLARRDGGSHEVG
jgi:hypothetical protein